MIRPILTLLAACIALALPLHAQAKPPVGIELRLLAFQSGCASDEVFAHDPAAPEDTPAVQTPLRSYLNHQFATVIFTGKRVVFTTSADRASLKKPDAVLAETSLPDGLRSAILLFLPGKKDDKHRYQILTIDDSKRAFPAGTFRVSNLSPQEVRIELEDKKYTFKPWATGFIKDPPVRDGDQSGMKAYALADGNWRRIGSGIWPHPGNNRVVQVLFLHPLTGQVQLRAFDDVPPREPTPQPQG